MQGGEAGSPLAVSMSRELVGNRSEWEEEVDALIADARADVELAVRWRAWRRAWRIARVSTARVVVGA